MSQTIHWWNTAEEMKTGLCENKKPILDSSALCLRALVKGTILFLMIYLGFPPTELKAMSMMDTLVKKEITGYRQDRWCEDHGGQARTVLADQTRIDCLTGTHAIKFESGPNWDRAIGQVLFYGLKTSKKLGIVLILETAEDQQNWQKMNSVIEQFHLPVQTWKIDE